MKIKTIPLTARQRLQTAPIGPLLFQFALPAILAGLVGALYNIVDQIFIGHGVGVLGNAATNVAFPLVTICTALALLVGIGATANFSLFLGKNELRKAGFTIGNGLSLLLLMSLVILVLVQLFLKPIALAFGATPNVLPYALTYLRITSLGIPFYMLQFGCSYLIRADASPRYSMLTLLSGAILNTILDPIFIFVLDMGIAGAAWATIMGQALATLFALYYFKHSFQSLRLRRVYFVLRWFIVKKMFALGITPFISNLSMMLVQVTLNNALVYYGSRSAYGADIPLAVAGIIGKWEFIFMSIALGFVNGAQPIIGYNYGAACYDRVLATLKRVILAVGVIGGVAFLSFQFFPHTLISFFGGGTEAYYTFAIHYFRIFMFMIFTNVFQPVCGNFYSTIGKPVYGVIVTLSRRVLFLIPLLFVLPYFWGISGILYAGPIADFVAALLVGWFLVRAVLHLQNLRTKQYAKEQLAQQ